MADTLTMPAAGAVVATDDVGGVHYQVCKLALGADGAATLIPVGQQLMAASMPVVLASDHGDLKVTLDSEKVVLDAGTAAIGKLAANSGIDIGDVDVISSALPTGAATSALQTALNALIAGGLPAALGAGGGLKVDGSGTALPVNGTVTANQGTAGGAAWPVLPSAQEVHLGEVGHKLRVVTATPTLTVAGAYNNNDFVGTSATAIVFANAVRVTGGTGKVISARLIDRALQSVSAELWLFSAAVTPPNDNAAWSISDSDAATFIGVIPFGTYYASALNSVSQVLNIQMGFSLLATTLYGCLVTRGAPTYASGDLTVTLAIEQN